MKLQRQQSCLFKDLLVADGLGPNYKSPRKSPHQQQLEHRLTYRTFVDIKKQAIAKHKITQHSIPFHLPENDESGAKVDDT